jgi:Cytochrome c oxidase biogenesis protein Cmc1 like
MRTRALRKCGPLTEAFAKCTEDRLLSIVWACRPELRALNECTKQQCVSCCVQSLGDSAGNLTHAISSIHIPMGPAF